MEFLIIIFYAFLSFFVLFSFFDFLIVFKAICVNNKLYKYITIIDQTRVIPILYMFANLLKLNTTASIYIGISFNAYLEVTSLTKFKSVFLNAI